MELDVYKKDGTKSGETVKLSADIFGIEPNSMLIYRAVRVYLDNQRQGTSKVKTRREVRGGGKKPFKQKHTGMARQGILAVTRDGRRRFDLRPEAAGLSATRCPAGMRRLARKSALSLKAKEGQIRVVEDFSFDGAEDEGDGDAC